jgi:hypothetical protein
MAGTVDFLAAEPNWAGAKNEPRAMPCPSPESPARWRRNEKQCRRHPRSGRRRLSSRENQAMELRRLCHSGRAGPTRSLDTLFLPGYIPLVDWDVEHTDEFESWWNSLTEFEQGSVNAKSDSASAAWARPETATFRRDHFIEALPHEKSSSSSMRESRSGFFTLLIPDAVRSC